MSDDVLLVEVADRIATVTMNRPQSRNALNRELPRTAKSVNTTRKRMSWLRDSMATRSALL